jgi:hypothetical protein
MRIPKSHRNLIENPYRISLSSITADGQPFSAPAWCFLDEDGLLVVVSRLEVEFHIQQNQHLSLLAFDPVNPLRNMEIRGQAVILEINEQLDLFANLGSSKSATEDNFSAPIPDVEHQLCFRITPERIRVEGGS